MPTPLASSGGEGFVAWQLVRDGRTLEMVLRSTVAPASPLEPEVRIELGERDTIRLTVTVPAAQWPNWCDVAETFRHAWLAQGWTPASTTTPHLGPARRPRDSHGPM